MVKKILFSLFIFIVSCASQPSEKNEDNSQSGIIISTENGSDTIQ